MLTNSITYIILYVSLKRGRNCFKSCPPIVVIDREGKRIRVNGSFSSFYGYYRLLYFAHGDFDTKAK